MEIHLFDNKLINVSDCRSIFLPAVAFVALHSIYLNRASSTRTQHNPIFDLLNKQQTISVEDGKKIQGEPEKSTWI